MTVAARFAAHALEMRFSDLPATAVERAKVYVLDSLGVGIAGSSVDGGDGLLRVASGWGAPAVPVWGRATRLAAPAAAFLNAWQMHNQEYDCLHEGAVVHALATTLPVALAAATQRGVTGRKLIAAVAVGADIAAGLGLASKAGFRFFRPGTAGGFGAVAAAARLLGLDRKALEAAFAWQLAQVSGTMQAHTEGSPILPAQVAFNARAALQSCELATLGWAPPQAIFEGPYGYLSLFEGAFELEPILESLGRDWRIAEFSHKPFPAGRATHGGIEGVMALQADHGFAAADVAKVEIDAPPLIVRLVGRPPRADARASYLRLCVAYAVARVLKNGAIDLSDFRGQALTDPETHVLAARVATRDDGNPDPNALAPQTVTVHLKNGAALSWRCKTMLAHPARPLTRDQHLAKFHRCLAFAATPLPPGTADRLIETVDRLESADDVGALGELAAGYTPR
ncbi:MAG: MmgE/PrpD family protein [Reyranella sp.]|uniref:MmgE/PrpD family protein n=1 Tax=Reyranella sp. TaxID=1929291 RepID=UPI001ACB5248|nr:MmgE/PrpD family protein [Reyranella sp.]MBN9090329.1 MmgE/PrpD family protein [Reyranella sp.]